MKKRNRIIYANEGLFAGPAFKYGVSYSENIHSPNLSKVKSIAYSAQINRQRYNVLGKNYPSNNHHSTHPEITLDISYGSASATNEKLLGLTHDSVDNSFIKNLVDITDDDNYGKNFYLVTAKEGIDFVSGDASDMESVLFFSNCYLNSYGYEIEVKSPPAVTANFVGENMGYFQTPKKSEDVVIYTSDFSAGTDGWGPSSMQSHFETHAGLTSYPHIHFRAAVGNHGHYLERTMLTVGKKYKVSGKVWINSSSPSLDSVRLFADPQSYIPLHIIDDYDQWVSFETEFTAANDVLSFWGWAGNDFEWEGAGSSPFDAFYIAEIVVTEISPPDPFEIYVSDFSSDVDGWDDKSYATLSVANGNLTMNVNSTAVGVHYAHRDSMLTVGRKYKLTGYGLIDFVAANVDHIRFYDGVDYHLGDFVGGTRGTWQYFSVEFTAKTDSISFYMHQDGAAGSGTEFAGNGATDIIYLKNIVVTELPFQDLKIPILNKKTGFEESYVKVAIPQGKKVDEQMLVPSEASISITKSSDSAANNSPDKIRGLSMWLDASEFSSRSNNESITSWADKMGNVTFTNTGDVKYRSTINGLPHCLEMDSAGGGGYMTSTSTLDDVISSKGYTVFIVNLPVGVITTTACGGGTVIGSNTWGHRARRSSGGVYYDQFYNLLGANSADCPLAVTRMNNVNLIVSSFDGTTSDICLKKIGPSYTDESCDYMSKPLSEITDLTSTLRIGADGYNGYIAEIIIYRRHLKDSEKAKVQKYLWNKYSWTLPMDFETETSVVNFENEKLQSLKFNLNLEREEENVVGYKIPLDRKIKFPVPVTSTLAFLADNTEEGSLATFLLNDETYDISTSFIRSQDDESLYVSDFSSSADGWDMTGGNLAWSNYNDPANDPEPDDYLQCVCDTSSSYHQAHLSPVLVAGKKYRLTGEIWLGDNVPNIESLVLRVDDGVGNNVVHFTVTSSMAGVWRPFSVEFEQGAGVSEAIKVTAVDGNDDMEFGAATTDVFYLQDFKLTEIERTQEILNIDFKGARLRSLSHNTEIGGNKQINLEINTFIHDTNEEAGFGFSGIYSS